MFTTFDFTSNERAISNSLSRVSPVSLHHFCLTRVSPHLSTTWSRIWFFASSPNSQYLAFCCKRITYSCTVSWGIGRVLRNWSRSQGVSLVGSKCVLIFYWANSYVSPEAERVSYISCISGPAMCKNNARFWSASVTPDAITYSSNCFTHLVHRCAIVVHVKVFNASQPTQQRRHLVLRAKTHRPTPRIFASSGPSKTTHKQPHKAHNEAACTHINRRQMTYGHERIESKKQYELNHWRQTRQDPIWLLVYLATTSGDLHQLAGLHETSTLDDAESRYYNAVHYKCDIFVWNWPIKINNLSSPLVFMAWCFTIRASVATLLKTQPCVSAVYGFQIKLQPWRYSMFITVTSLNRHGVSNHWNLHVTVWSTLCLRQQKEYIKIPYY